MSSFPLDWHEDTVKSMVWSAGFSCVAAVFLGSHPKTMAGIGALAALTHSCTSEILRRLNLHPLSASVLISGIPFSMTSSLHILGSLLLTRNILRLLGGPTFNMAATAILMTGIQFLNIHSLPWKPGHLTYITL